MIAQGNTHHVKWPISPSIKDVFLITLTLTFQAGSVQKAAVVPSLALVLMVAVLTLLII